MTTRTRTRTTDVVSQETRDQPVAAGWRVADACDEQDPFVRECLAAGFMPDPERWQTSFGPPLTTRANFVRWTDGTLWLAHSSRRLTAKGMGQPPATRELQDFVPRSTRLSTADRDGYKQRSLFE